MFQWLHATEVSSCSFQGAGLEGDLSHSDSETEFFFCLMPQSKASESLLPDSRWEKEQNRAFRRFHTHHFCSHSVVQNSVTRLCFNTGETGKCNPAECWGGKLEGGKESSQ